MTEKWRNDSTSFSTGTMIHNFKFYRQRIIGSGEDGGS